MAEKPEIVELGSIKPDGKGAAFLAESSFVARFVAWAKALFGLSEKGAVLAPNPSERGVTSSSSSSACSSARIERIMRSRTGFAREVDWEIEASKDHWSQPEPKRRSEESSSDSEHLTNREILERLQRQFPEMNCFFRDGAGFVEVGEKIAEGGQADIFAAKVPGYDDHKFVLKVFKAGSLMRDLQKQWPLGMQNRISWRGTTMESNATFSSFIWRGTVVMNGRFAFVMERCWGDLRKLMDKRMERTNNRCPPFNFLEIRWNMHQIAEGMRGLHEDNIIHRDLKASNVLIDFPFKSREEDDSHGNTKSYYCEVADYECSVGVVGTGFWRAPEILQGVKDHKIAPNLFTKKSDVYSFAMTCYEMVTGKIPFEGLLLNEYDVVLRGARPILPEDTKPWIKELLSRCWHHDPTERPDFADIVDYIKSCGHSRLHRKSWLFFLGF